MLRRLTIIAAVAALGACDGDITRPADFRGAVNLEEGRTTVPPEMCFDYVVDDDFAIVPGCVNAPNWPAEQVLLTRTRHGYESVSVGSRGSAGTGGRRPALF